MMFNSVEFLCFFAAFISVFFFLPNTRTQNLWILAVSYFFYAYWSVAYLFLLMAVMFIDYFAALKIDSSTSPSTRKWWLATSLSLNLGILAFFKYLGLFTETIAWLSGQDIPKIHLLLPFGISFYTFHAMSYTIDVYRRILPAEKDYGLYSCYVLFFPQLVAGPIARASHLLPQFETYKRPTISNFSLGSYWIMKGFLYKVVFADSFGGFVDAYWGGFTTRTPLLVTESIYFFAFQIYCDFCGYTCIARGIAKWLDFDLTENFRAPYFSTSITDFWRRWHISLSSWLKDYLYISLGGNRYGLTRTYANLLITMGLGGLWHGGSWTFLVWGLLHGSYLSIEKFLSATNMGKKASAHTPTWAKQLLVFHLVCFAWVFFRATSFDQALQMLGYVGQFVSDPSTWILSQIHHKLAVYAVFLFVFEWCEVHLQLEERFKKLSIALCLSILYFAMLIITLLAELNPQSFIYFQF